MIRQILFIQGGGEGVHDTWDNWLVDSLRAALGAAYVVSYPRMPDEQDPHRDAWAAAIRRELQAVGEHPVLVAHSIGASILLDVLADPATSAAPAAVFCIAAPYIGEGGWPAGEIAEMRNLGARLPRCPIYFYQGDRDDTVPGHLDLYARALPQAITRLLPGRDHQLNDDLTEIARDIAALS